MARRNTVRHPEEIRALRRECAGIRRYEDRIREIERERNTLLWKMSGCHVQNYEWSGRGGYRETEYGKYVEEREDLRMEEERLRERIRRMEVCLNAVEPADDRLCLWRIYVEGGSLKELADDCGISAQSLYRRLRMRMDEVFEDEAMRRVMNGAGGI